MRSIDQQLQDDADLSFAHRKLQQEIDYLLSLRDQADHGWIIFDEGDNVLTSSGWSFALPAEAHIPSHDSWSDEFGGYPTEGDYPVKYGSEWHSFSN